VDIHEHIFRVLYKYLSLMWRISRFRRVRSCSLLYHSYSC